MSVDRQSLEAAALIAVSSENYYDLADNIQVTTNEELQMIIDGRESELEIEHDPTIDPALATVCDGCE